MKNKRNNGITLIALVVTIIVLLILAGISIAMLSGNNGILQKATIAKENTDREAIIETAKMDILSKQTENHGSLNADELEEILTSPNYNTQGSLSNEEAILNKTLTSKDGKYEIPVSEIYNGTLSSSVLTFAIDYGSKTAQTIEVGDDLTIETENFRVIRKDNNTIYAIAHYNLVLNSNPMVQANASNALNAGTVAFHDSYGWGYTAPRGDIDMENVENNLKQYIDKYQMTLSNNFGASKVIARMPKEADLPEYSNLIAPFLRNPSGIGNYWIATRANDHGNLYYVEGRDGVYGSMDDDCQYYNADFVGVRPIIEITYDDV